MRHRVSIRAAAAASAAMLLLAALAPSCGIFDTREPSQPGGGSQTPQERQTDPDKVLINFRNALAYKDDGLYDGTLREEFKFIPDEADRLYFQATTGNDIFEDWGRDEELSALSLIFSESESLTVSFDVEPYTQNPGSTLIRLDYRFRRRITQDSIPTFKGFAEVLMREDDLGLWSIGEWADQETSVDFLTWGRLKGSTVGGD